MRWTAVHRGGLKNPVEVLKKFDPLPPTLPRGPKDRKNSRFRSGLKISSENEIFERATHRGPIFCGEIETSRLKFSSEIKNVERDQKFRSGSNFFNRWALWVSVPPRCLDLAKISLAKTHQPSLQPRVKM